MAIARADSPQQLLVDVADLYLAEEGVDLLHPELRQARADRRRALLSTLELLFGCKDGDGEKGVVASADGLVAQDASGHPDGRGA